MSLTGHIAAVRGLGVSTRHPYLFSAGEDKMVKCWDLEVCFLLIIILKCIISIVQQSHSTLSWSFEWCLFLKLAPYTRLVGNRRSRLYCSCMGYAYKTTSVCLGMLLFLQKQTGHTSTVASIQCQDADPQIITSSNDATVRLWDLAAGKTMCTLTHHKKSVVRLIDEDYSVP